MNIRERSDMIYYSAGVAIATTLELLFWQVEGEGGCYGVVALSIPEMKLWVVAVSEKSSEDFWQR